MVARRISVAVLIIVLAGMSSLSSLASVSPARRPLSTSDVDAITTLVRLENTRTLD
jgi:hypothetical protein